jgi:membrane protease subunit (stomatin/prohibitin family)
MGLLKAIHGAVGSVLEEQWKEYFRCDALRDDTLLVRARKQIGNRSANTRKDDDVLTNGSVISVADGQCVLIVKQGKVLEVCMEPGEHVFEDPEQRGLKGFFREVGRRVAFGGGDIQPVVYRVYYMNTKEMTGIPFRSPGAIPFRLRDGVTALDLDAAVSLGGCFSYRVSDPVKLYKTIIGNVSGRFGREEIRSHMQAELAACLQPALGRMAERGLRPSQLPEQVPTLCETLRELMNARWCGEHGLELVSLALDSFDAKDGDLIQSAQHAAMLQDPTLAAATLTQATAEALSEAAANGGN